MNFIEHMLLTWLHIITGISLLLIIVLATSAISKLWYEYVEQKENSEMEKLRRAMTCNKNEMDSRR